MPGKIFSYFFEACLFLFIIVSPLFYGLLLPAPFIIFAFTVFFALALLLIRSAVLREPGIFIPKGTLFFAFFIFIVILQIVPLPNFLLSLFPKTAALYRQYHPSYNVAQGYTISLYVFNTKEALVRYCCFFGVFFLALNSLSRRRQFERICITIVVWSVALCLYGLVRKYLVLGKTLTDSFSVFGNRNHFAAYMVMAAALAVGYALACDKRSKRIVFLFFGAIIVATIFLSGSRGGAVSVIIALCGLFALLHRFDIIKRNGWIVLAGLGGGFVLFGMVGFAPLLQRLSADGFSLGGRFLALRSAVPMIRDFPLMGVGLGNFHLGFTLYRDFPSDTFWYYLHSDPIQLVIETGFIGAAAYYIFFVMVFRSIVRQLRIRRDPFVVSLVIGGGCGLVAVMVHSFFDFDFHIPAVSFLFWLLSGILYKCAHTRFVQ